MFEDVTNPASVFVKTIYSVTLEIAYPTGTVEEWIDYYPDDSQTYYTEKISLNGIYLGLISLLLVLPMLKRYKK